MWNLKFLSNIVIKIGTSKTTRSYCFLKKGWERMSSLYLFHSHINSALPHLQACGLNHNITTIINLVLRNSLLINSKILQGPLEVHFHSENPSETCLVSSWVKSYKAYKTKANNQWNKSKVVNCPCIDT